MHLEGYLGDKYIRESLAIRSWDVAQARVRELDTNCMREVDQHFLSTFAKPPSRPRTHFLRLAPQPI
jgi:hypothetical protein